MININNNLNEMFEFANVDNNDLDGGDDLEDGEIFDDEAEAEEKSETEVTKSAKVEIQKPLSASPASNSVAASPLFKTVLKNDTHNVSENNEKKFDKFAAQQQRWTDENSPKKEERKSREQPYDGDKRFKEKKMKRKKPKDEDSENDGPAKFKGKKRKTSFERELEKLEDSDYIDEEDEEMLNIRGASPSRWLDMFSDEEEEDDSFDGSEGGRGGRENTRGGGRGGRRGGRGFRGGRIDRNARRERIERLSGRGKRRGKGVGMRGGKKGGDEKEICIYHMQGKCHRGDDCPYSHDAMPPRKMELCKFYLMDCCAKKDKCLYMHAEFPCKYFHTGLKCFAGKNCKFSHAKLTDDLRAILNKTYGLTCISEFTNNQQEETGRPNHRQHLETAPKEILGDFPRLREVTRPLKKNNKKIPSLFDVKISPPSRDMRSQSDSDGNHTPMPSPTHQPNNKDFFRDSMERDQTPPPLINERPRRSEHHHHHHKSGGSGESQHRSSRSGSQPQSRRPSERGGRLEAAAERRERRGGGDRKAEAGGGRRSSKEDQEQHHSHHRHHHHHHENSMRRQQQAYSPPSRHRYEEEEEEEQQHEEREEEEHVNERLKAPEPDQSSNDILSHLPKKQRELFLRIQQQQRQAENSQESNPEDEDQDNDYNKQEENWYSSEDEESTPLTTILKTINIQQKPSMTAAAGLTLSSNQQRSHNHHNDRQSHAQVSDEYQPHESSASSSSALPASIQDIDFGDVSALLSKVKQHFQATTERLKVRDPRLRPESEPSENKPHQHSTSSDSHARNTHAPAQLSPSISAILNSAGRGQHPSYSSSSSHQSAFDSRSSPSHHNSSSSSFPSRLSPPSSHSSSFAARSPPSSSSSSHHHSSSSFPSYSSSHRSSFPPATPMLNDDDDDDDDDGIASRPPPEDDSVNLAGLPFKPAPVHTAATEIDASINSHPPIVYRLTPIQPSKPDYSILQTMPAGGALDPRWRKAARFSGGGGAGDESGAVSRRDPRHRLADLPSHVADPRQRAAINSSSSNANHSSLAPPTPRYDDDVSPMSSVRGGGMATPQVDAMYCPPTPRLDDSEPTPPSTLRPTDPRQRHHNMLSQQNQPQPGMTSLYDQMRQQQQMQFMPNQQPMMYEPIRPMYGSDNVNNRQGPYTNYK